MKTLESTAGASLRNTAITTAPERGIWLSIPV